MRKTGTTLEEQRARLRKDYTRGSRVNLGVTADAKLDDQDRAYKKDLAAVLHVVGFTHVYIADAVGVSSHTITSWFAEPDVRERIALLRTDVLSNGVKLAQTYIGDLLEMLYEIAMNDEDPDRRMKAAHDLLDRVGLTKINKSESASAISLREQREIDITDKTGLVELAKNAPPEVQAAMAENAERIIALAQEHAQ